MREKVRVAIVDDETLIREGVRRILDTFHGVHVVASCTGAEAAGEAERRQPDVVLLDFRMPHREGLKTLEELRMLNRPPVVAMLTAFGTEENLAAALRGGAAGFLLKDTSPEQLEYAISELARGNAVIDPRVTRAVIRGYVNPRPGRSAVAGNKNAQLAPAEPRARADWAASTGEAETEEFTAREREVLALLAEGFSNTEIAKALYIGVTTVKGHVSALLGKLGVTNRVQAAVRAHQLGLVG